MPSEFYSMHGLRTRGCVRVIHQLNYNKIKKALLIHCYHLQLYTCGLICLYCLSLLTLVDYPSPTASMPRLYQTLLPDWIHQIIKPKYFVVFNWCSSFCLSMTHLSHTMCVYIYIYPSVNEVLQLNPWLMRTFFQLRTYVS